MGILNLGYGDMIDAYPVTPGRMYIGPQAWEALYLVRTMIDAADNIPATTDRRKRKRILRKARTAFLKDFREQHGFPKRAQQKCANIWQIR